MAGNTGAKSQEGSQTPLQYDETLEAKNRDACRLMAEHYNSACKEASRKDGHFVFLSAAPSIAPLLK